VVDSCSRTTTAGKIGYSGIVRGHLYDQSFCADTQVPAGYRPAALEGLAYLFIPIFECVLIALFIIVRSALPRPHNE